jgi:hypothetical protein
LRGEGQLTRKEVMREVVGGSPIRGDGTSKAADASEERRNGRKTGEERRVTKWRGRERGPQEPGETDARRRYHFSEDLEGSDQWWRDGGVSPLRAGVGPNSPVRWENG